MIGPYLTAAAEATTLGDCGGDHAPDVYKNESCSGTNICELNGGSNAQINCHNLSGNGGAGAQVFAVEDYNQTGNRTYSIFGTIDGASFCCWVNDNPVPHLTTSITLDGTEFDDSLSFGWSTLKVTHAATKAYGRAGDDLMLGSNVGGGTWDYLVGGGGSDDLTGHAGDDQLCGFDCFGGGTSADDDTLDAGDGVDLLEGDG
ncbi:MAG: hypothetical protein ABMA64_40910, partial [Myxococcota bacterium]